MLKNISLRVKLIASAVLMSLFVLVIGAGSYLAITAQLGEYNFLATSLPSIQELQQIRVAKQKIQSYLLALANPNLDADTQAEFMEKLDRQKESFITALRRFETKTMTEEEQGHYETFKAANDKFLAETEAALTAVKIHVRGGQPPEDLPEAFLGGETSAELVARFTASGESLEMLSNYVVKYYTLTRKNEGEEASQRNRLYLILLSAAAFLVSLFLGILLAVRTSRSILHTVDQLTLAAQGDLDVSLPTDRKDEMGRLSVHFNGMVSNIKRLIRSINIRMRDLSDLSKRLSVDMGQTRRDIVFISKHLTAVRDRMRFQVDQEETTTVVIEELTKNVESLTRVIDTQSASVEQSSAAIEEMIANTRTITTSTRKAEEAVSSLVRTSHAGQESLEDVSGTVKDVSSNSSSLMDANTIIAGIAEQTNLLAMNAAIEAAHAGEAGRGFAVVAEEIRKLAEQSNDQSLDIASNLENVVESIDLVVDSAGQTDRAFDSIRSAVDQVSAVVNHVKASMEEQSSGGTEILSAMTTMKDLTAQVQQGSGEMNKAGEIMLESVHSLHEISSEVQEAVSDIEQRIDGINLAAEAIEVLSKGIDKDVHEVMDAARWFRFIDEENGDEPAETPEPEVSLVDLAKAEREEVGVRLANGDQSRGGKS